GCGRVQEATRTRPGGDFKLERCSRKILRTGGTCGSQTLALQGGKRSVEGFHIGRVFVQTFGSIPRSLKLCTKLLHVTFNLSFRSRGGLVAGRDHSLVHRAKCLEPCGIGADRSKHLDGRFDLRSCGESRERSDRYQG